MPESNSAPPYWMLASGTERKLESASGRPAVLPVVGSRASAQVLVGQLDSRAHAWCWGPWVGVCVRCETADLGERGRFSDIHERHAWVPHECRQKQSPMQTFPPSELYHYI